MVKEARVDVILQRIDEDIGDELNVHPKHVRRYGVNNIFTRAFAYLLGWRNDGKPVKLNATTGGLLKVAISGAGFEQIDTLTGTAGLSWSSVLTFAWIPNRIRFESLDYPYEVKFSLDKITWSDSVIVDEGTPRDYDICAKYIKVKRFGGNDATYWAIAMK